MTSATSDSSTGVGEHYWTVTLTPPTGASTALVQFVTMAQDAIQTSVDLLGRGMPDLPPVMDDLLTSVTYQDLGEGTASSNYQALLSEIESRQTSLLSSDSQVMQASITVSASTDTTLQYIEQVVDQLQSEFTSIKGTLTASENEALMEQIGEAVDLVNARVTSVYETNQSIAGTSSASGTGSGSGSGASSTGATTAADTAGTSSSGSSDLTSLLSSLLEMPMMFVPMLASLAPQLLKDLAPNQTKNQKNQNGSNTTSANTGQPAAAPANTAQPAPAATPTNAAQPATAPANTAQPNAAPGTTNSPTTGSNQPAPAN